jgi:restriction system protein
MQASTARDYVLDRALDIDHHQFELLCKMVIERAEQTRELELTPFRGDGGIDVRAIIDRDLFHARLGLQAKQYQPGNTVGTRTLRSFKGALSDQDYHIGTVITTSSYTNGAIESAERDYIRLIDGERLGEIMVGSEIGVSEAAEGAYERDHEFWDVFRKPEDSDVIPSLEVPQADNVAVVRHVLRAVDSGSDTKPDITRYLERQTGDEWAPRQADYYGMAGWLLGFLHKEKRVRVENQNVRRWGLTRDGEEYLTFLRRGDRKAATARLHDAIREVEIVSRIYDVLERQGHVKRRDIADIIADETELSGSTTSRRARTVGQWLVELPEVTTYGTGDSQAYEYTSRDLDDVN